jgi:hypothetical protein
MVADGRHQPAPSQHPEGALFVRVKHNRVFGGAIAYESHYTVAARLGPLHDAAVAIDGQRCHKRQVLTSQ